MPPLSDNVIIAFAAAVPPTVVAFASLIVALTNARKSNARDGKVQELGDKVEMVHKATNSMKDALVAKTERAAMAEGLAQGKVEGKAEQRAEDADRKGTEIVT